MFPCVPYPSHLAKLSRRNINISAMNHHHHHHLVDVFVISFPRGLPQEATPTDAAATFLSNAMKINCQQQLFHPLLPTYVGAHLGGGSEKKSNRYCTLPRFPGGRQKQTHTHTSENHTFFQSIPSRRRRL